MKRMKSSSKKQKNNDSLPMSIIEENDNSLEAYFEECIGTFGGSSNRNSSLKKPTNYKK